MDELPGPTRPAQLFAEFLGTALLLAVVVGSGIAAERLSPRDVGLQLLENALATSAGLVALILALGPVSGAHFNPIVTVATRVLGGMSTSDAARYVIAQICGAVVGAGLGNMMFSEPAIELSTKARAGGGLWLAEAVATFGLLLVIFGVARSGRTSAAPFAVGGYIGAAYFFTASTSFANPAVTLARTLTDTFAGIEPSSAPAFVAFQLVGGGLAVAAVRLLYPSIAASAPEVVLPTDANTSLAAASRVPTSLPVLTGGLARERLRALAQALGALVSDVPEVLFVCVHNAGRSQMAAALLDHHAGGRVHVRSAGSVPADRINPAAVEALAEIGLDVTKEFPKPLTDEVVRASDVVVTMGCGDACPIYPGKKYLDWQLDDPAGKPVEAVRQIRDEIDRRVRGLLEELTSDQR